MNQLLTETLETDRLLLKPVTPSLINEMFSTKTKEEIFAFFGFEESDYQHYKNMHEKGMETHRLSLFLFVVVRKSDNLPIGECGFHTWNRSHNRAELFYLLRKDEFKNQGFMTEALPQVLDYGFNVLGLHRIAAMVDINNLPSVALLKKYGFTHEDSLREDYLVNGKQEDSECYSLLRHEWDRPGKPE